MPHKREKLIADVVMAAEDIAAFCADKGYEQFAGDRLLQAAIERKLEIIGEALNRLSRLDEEWLVRVVPESRQIIGLRNIIAHGYDVVDYDILWDVVVNHVPGLKAALEAV